MGLGGEVSGLSPRRTSVELGPCVLSWSGILFLCFQGALDLCPQAFPNISPSTPCHGAHAAPQAPDTHRWGRCGPILPLGSCHSTLRWHQAPPWPFSINGTKDSDPKD